MLSALLALAIAAAPAHGTVRPDSLDSDALGVRKRMVVYLPPSYDAASRRRYPVVYLLHGLFGDETNWTRLGGVDAAMDSLIAAGGREMIVVMPDGDDGWYTTWAHPADRALCAADTTRTEPASAFCVATARYDAYVAHDLVRYVDRHYRTLAERDGRAIAGLSMGGYGAITLALRYPREFAAAASHSGVLAPLYGGSNPEAQRRFYKGVYPSMARAFGDDSASWAGRDPAPLLTAMPDALRPALFVDVGIDDPFVDESRAFVAAAQRVGADVTYSEWPGTHAWVYWRTHVRESLAWLASRLASSAR